MRIVQLNNFARVTGGADRHCLELASLQRQAGHDVRFVATEDTGNIETRGEFVPTTVTNATRDTMPLRRRPGIAARALWNPEAAAAMARTVEQFNPDVIHAHKLYPQLSVSPLVVARRAGVPIVQTLHDFELMAASHADDRGGWIDRHEERLSYRALNTATFGARRLIHRRAIDGWVAISHFIADAYARAGVGSRVIENFVLPADTKPLGFDDRRGVVHMGWLAPKKGLDLVLEAAARLKDIPFTIAGSGPGSEQVAALAAELDNVEFLGRLAPDGTAAILGAARVCLVPSQWQEPGGLTALEAMAHGTPVIASPRGGLAEYVGGAGNPLADGIDELCEWCQAVCGDRGLFDALSAAGVAAAKGRHSPDRYLEKLERLYLGVTEGR